MSEHSGCVAKNAPSQTLLQIATKSTHPNPPQHRAAKPQTPSPGTAPNPTPTPGSHGGPVLGHQLRGAAGVGVHHNQRRLDLVSGAHCARCDGLDLGQVGAACARLNSKTGGRQTGKAAGRSEGDGATDGGAGRLAGCWCGESALQ